MELRLRKVEEENHNFEPFLVGQNLGPEIISFLVVGLFAVFRAQNPDAVL